MTDGDTQEKQKQILFCFIYAASITIINLDLFHSQH